MSDPTLSVIEFQNKMTWVCTTLKRVNQKSWFHDEALNRSSSISAMFILDGWI